MKKISETMYPDESMYGLTRLFDYIMIDYKSNIMCVLYVNCRMDSSNDILHP